MTGGALAVGLLCAGGAAPSAIASLPVASNPVPVVSATADQVAGPGASRIVGEAGGAAEAATSSSSAAHAGGTAIAGDASGSQPAPARVPVVASPRPLPVASAPPAATLPKPPSAAPVVPAPSSVLNAVKATPSTGKIAPSAPVALPVGKIEEAGARTAHTADSGSATRVPHAVALNGLPTLASHVADRLGASVDRTVSGVAGRLASGSAQATIGQAQASIQQARATIGRGIVGAVAQTLRPVGSTTLDTLSQAIPTTANGAIGLVVLPVADTPGPTLPSLLGYSPLSVAPISHRPPPGSGQGGSSTSPTPPSVSSSKANSAGRVTAASAGTAFTIASERGPANGVVGAPWLPSSTVNNGSSHPEIERWLSSTGARMQASSWRSTSARAAGISPSGLMADGEYVFASVAVATGETASHRGPSTPPAAPRPAPAVPAGESSTGTASSSGSGFTIFFLALAGLLALGIPRAMRRMRLASEPLCPAPFALVPDRPG